MRILALLTIVAACSAPPEPSGVGRLEGAIIGVNPGNCNTDDLRMWSEPNFQGTRLCLRGLGPFTGIINYLGTGPLSYNAGIYGGQFHSVNDHTQSYKACTTHPTDDSIVENSDTVDRLLEPVDLLGGGSCP
jgi:hypothetical protein